MGTSCAVSAVVLVLLVTSLFGATLAPGGTAAETVLATPNGKIVTGDTTGLTVGQVAPPLTVKAYPVPETRADLLPDPPPGNGSTLLWGYEAGAVDAKILTYNIATAATPHTGQDCVPPGSLNGRGLAMDPLDGYLWYTFVTFPLFEGDGYIHKTNPPNTSVPCTLVTSIPFGDGPGGTIQDDIGALDIDQGSKHIWAAGYKPVCVGGVGPPCAGGVLRSYLYLVNRNNGKIIHSCWIPFRSVGTGVGNDTLAYARLKGLPGSGEYLLTDAGEDVTFPDSLAVIDTADCHSGAEVTPVAEFLKSVGMTGIDFEWPGLLATDGLNLFNLGGPPFFSPTPIGSTETFLEGIALCGFRAKLGGDGNDHCPY